MRAAIYARVSSERQEKEHTIGSQLEALRAYAATNGMDVVEEFTDEGYSGARLDRPALDRMRDLAERRGFEVLLTYCTDRLARKFVLQALNLDELERFGVKTIFLEGGAACGRSAFEADAPDHGSRCRIRACQDYRKIQAWQALSGALWRDCFSGCAFRLRESSPP